MENWQGHMAVTLPIVLAAVRDFGATTPLALKIGQTRPLFLAILKRRKPLVRPALPDAVNRAEGAFMTPALYPAPRSQGDEVCTLCRKPAAEAEGESHPQRLTAGQTALGYPSPTPRCESGTQGDERPKGGGVSTLISEGGSRRSYMAMPILFIGRPHLVGRGIFRVEFLGLGSICCRRGVVLS